MFKRNKKKKLMNKWLAEDKLVCVPANVAKKSMLKWQEEK